MKHSTKLAGIAFALTTQLALAAEAKPIRLGPGFAPNPLVTREVVVPTGDSYLSDRGFNKCGSNHVTDDPALTWTITKPMLNLRVRLENRRGGPAGSAGIIVAPNGTYFCDDRKGEIYIKSWAKGTYKLYLAGGSRKLSATVRFETPLVSVAAVKKATARLPKTSLSDVKLNPDRLSLASTVSVEAADLGNRCAKKHQRIMPLVSLRVTRPSHYLLRHKLELFVIANDRCYRGADAPALPAGEHQLWAVIPHGQTAPKRFEIEIDDRDRALAFAKADIKDVGDLSSPLVIPGVVRPAQSWGSRNRLCSGAARTPDFYLKSTQPLQHVQLSLLWARKPQRLHLYGPLGEQTKNHSPRCGAVSTSSHEYKFDIFKGTYAIWIGSDNADTHADTHANAAGSTFHMLLRRSDVAVDPLTTFVPIPKLLSVPEMSVRNHYPYARSSSIPKLFTTAPKRLFIYPAADVNTRQPLHAGEPLLVVRQTNYKTTGYRYNGKTVALNNKLVTTTPPKTIWLPAKPKVPEAKSLARARDLAGPEDAKALARFNKIDAKYTRCLGNYLAKHDPTWGKNHEVYVAQRNGKVVNVSDRVGRRGARKCGAKRFDRAANKLIKTLAKSRNARYAKRLNAVRKRFGL